MKKKWKGVRPWKNLFMDSLLPCWNSGRKECNIKPAHILQLLNWLFKNNRNRICSLLLKIVSYYTKIYIQFWIKYCGQNLKQLHMIKTPVKFFQRRVQIPLCTCLCSSGCSMKNIQPEIADVMKQLKQRTVTTSFGVEFQLKHNKTSPSLEN